MNSLRVLRELVTSLVLGIVMITSSQVRAADVVNVGKQFNCKICHVNRLKELKGGDEPTLVSAESIVMESYGPQDSASTQRMCLSCHDGYVLDSRFVWSGEHTTHPVGIALPASMEIKKVGNKPALPLNKEGEVYCGTCHHGHPGKGAAAGEPTFIRTDREKGELCSNCHADKTKIAGSPHAKIRKSNQPPDFDDRGICGRCHTPHKNKGPLMWRKSPAEGVNTTVNSLCRGCHKRKPTPAEHPANILAWSQSVREAFLGKSVTEMPVFNEQAQHAIRGSIRCPTCHNPHQQRPEGLAEDLPGYFLRLENTEGFMCADCHKSSALFRYQFFHSDKRR